MKDTFHGVLSLFMIFGSVVVGFVAIAAQSSMSAWLYGAGCVLCFGVIVFSYCSKCACKAKGCRHLFPGKLAGLLPKREQGRYSFWDYVGVILPLGFIFAFPQMWLQKDALLWVLFWMLAVMALLEIIFFVCKGCANSNCTLQNVRNRFPNCSSPCK